MEDEPHLKWFVFFRLSNKKRFIKKWTGYKLNTFFLRSIAVILTCTGGGIGIGYLMTYQLLI
ncbi:hypothetical protein A361_06600 [Cytobacillus oceanisediminis 2691]|jgi:hypothetical protein|uniref:Uncharacterized protein n=2 Tax=Cytobacillus oceanisediminis TaxID=665099 RepID=A0A160M8A1_9BACI|nr:hypothetical protein A361_06600 [Cytobacillus oceanisediminis 2691]OHX47707.1 hypothetical protein BBV17_19900 [Cytobacillus oceanisediminis]